MELLEAANAILVSFQTLSDVLDNPPQLRGWETNAPVRSMRHVLLGHSNDFKENMDSLLGPLADKKGALADLCDNPQDEKWKAAGLAAAVYRQCAQSYERIQDTLERMRTLLNDIQTGVGEAALPPNGNNDALDLTSDNDPAQILTDPEIPGPNAGTDPFVSLECIEIRKQLLEQFGKHNEELNGLVCSDTPTPAMAASQRPMGMGHSTIHKPIVHFWQHAKTLYDFISRSWHCKCHKLHQTNLLLQHRDNHEVEFNLLFLFGGNSIDTPQRWAWQDITLKPLKPQERKEVVVEPEREDTPEGCLIPSMEPQPNRPKVKGLTRPTSKVRKIILSLGFKPKQKKAVLNSSPSAPLSTERKVAFSGIGQPRNHTKQNCDDLCETFKTHRSQQKWNEVLSSGNALYSLSQGSNVREKRCTTRTKTTLGNLLDSGYLNLPECCLLALVLASSVYQLHSSPWLQTSWDKRQIVFFSSFTDSNKILKDRPFLSGEHFHGNANASLPSAHGPGDLVVESLGIALLELCFGKTLEKFPEYTEMGEVKPSHSFSHGFASNLLPRAYNQLGSEFADAIQWCLTHRQINLEDDSWRNELFHNVIIPLHDVYFKSTIIPGGAFLNSGGIIHSDISNGGVGFFDRVMFEGGTNYIGGTHITHVYASETVPEQVSAVA